MGRDEYYCKILIVGQKGVGKSSILCKFTENFFSPGYSPTIGVDFRCKTIKNVKLTIWDTSGDERFKIMTSSYQSNSNIFICVYDVTNFDSLYGLESFLKNIKKNERIINPIIFIVGTKVDDKRNRIIEKSKGAQFARERNLFYTEVSSLTGEGIEDLFNAIATEYLKNPVLRTTTIKDNSTKECYKCGSLNCIHKGNNCIML